MDFTKIKVIKKLGTGMVATVYLIKYNNKEYKFYKIAINRYIKINKNEIKIIKI